MISLISGFIVEKLKKNKIIESNKSDVCLYGFEILISSVLTLGITLLLGFLLHCILESVLYLLLFAGLRQICGGYHAKNYLRCNVTYTIVSVLVLGFYKIIPLNSLFTLHYLFLLFAVIVIFEFSPVENKNKKSSEEKKQMFRVISRVTVVSLSAVSCLLYLFEDPLAKLMDGTLFEVACSIVVVKLQRKEGEQ